MVKGTIYCIFQFSIEIEFVVNDLADGKLKTVLVSHTIDFISIFLYIFIVVDDRRQVYY